MGTKSFRNRNEFLPPESFYYDAVRRTPNVNYSFTYLGSFRAGDCTRAKEPTSAFDNGNYTTTRNKSSISMLLEKAHSCDRKALSARMGVLASLTNIATMPEWRGKNVKLKFIAIIIWSSAQLESEMQLNASLKLNGALLQQTSRCFHFFTANSGFVRITSFQITIIC